MINQSRSIELQSFIITITNFSESEPDTDVTDVNDVNDSSLVSLEFVGDKDHFPD